MRRTLLLVAVIGCGGEDHRPAQWEYISPIILQPNCATVSCHSRAAAVAGLDFSDPDRGYISLTKLKIWIVDPEGTDGCKPAEGTTVCQRNARPLVTPFDPTQSRLVHLLRARNAPRMPPDRPLPEVDIRLIESWILDGARKSTGAPAGDASVEGGPAPETVPTDAGAERGG
jgi:hypothetical protein